MTVDVKFASRCGLYCKTCEFRKSEGCKGCMEMDGDVFWGTCPLAKCSIERELSHCGKCSDFACNTLVAFSFMEEYGDNGARIEALKRRNEIGDEKWVEEMEKTSI